MAVESYTTQLERVQTAIAAIEGGAQSYEIGGRKITRATLRDLYAREQQLRLAISRQARGGVRVRLAAPQ